MSTPSSYHVDIAHQDLYLFDYYLERASSDIELTPNSAYARKIGIPTMAAHDQGLLCSLMATGAARLCCDLLLDAETPDSVDTLASLLEKSQSYHEVSLRGIYRQMAMRRPDDLGFAHANAAYLFPYPLARRRISRLLNRRPQLSPGRQRIAQAETATDLEWIVFLRGIRTLQNACWTENSTPDLSTPEPDAMDPAISSHIMHMVSKMQTGTPKATRQPQSIGSKHPMFPVISATMVAALDALQDKVDELQRRNRSWHRATTYYRSYEDAHSQTSASALLAACSLAVDLLAATGNIMSAPDAADHPDDATLEAVSATGRGEHYSWLKAYCGTAPVYHPSQPLTHLITTWLNRVPSQYIALLMRPLKTPVPESSRFNVEHELQLLAWDIYAHWLVFSILIENESWWFADLGVSDIKELRGTLRPYLARNGGEGDACEHWWPSSMCAIAEQLHRHGGRGDLCRLG